MIDIALQFDIEEPPHVESIFYSHGISACIVTVLSPTVIDILASNGDTTRAQSVPALCGQYLIMASIDDQDSLTVRSYYIQRIETDGSAIGHDRPITTDESNLPMLDDASQVMDQMSIQAETITRMARHLQYAEYYPFLSLSYHVARTSNLVRRTSIHIMKEQIARMEQGRTNRTQT